jgi:hypothetical protein
LIVPQSGSEVTCGGINCLNLFLKYLNTPIIFECNKLLNSKGEIPRFRETRILEIFGRSTIKFRSFMKYIK